MSYNSQSPDNVYTEVINILLIKGSGKNNEGVFNKYGNSLYECVIGGRHYRIKATQ